jgi:TorA maturation chaperone TorD
VHSDQSIHPLPLSPGCGGEDEGEGGEVIRPMAKPPQPTLETLQPLTKIRGDLYGLLSSAYIHLPEKKILELNWEPDVEILTFPQEGSEEVLRQIQKGLNLVKSYQSKKNLTDDEILTNLSKDWTRLFRGVVRDGILPPYESLYRTERRQKKSAQEINRLFSKMGVQIPEEWHQPSDYIGVELDFMRFLCGKETRLRDDGERSALREAVETEKSFLEDHIALWIPIFCKRMLEEAREEYYRGIAHLTLGLVEFDRLWVSRLLD